MNLHIDRIIVGQLEVNCYIVSDGCSSEALVIDPGDEFERIRDIIDGRGLKPKHILFTHAHHDHVCAAKELKDEYGALVIMHEDEFISYQNTRELCISWGYESEDFPPPDKMVRDGDKVSAGKAVFEVLHTPGHTPGSVCIYGEKHLFTGDTLFKGSVGRTDLPGGNTERLLSSLKRLSLLPPDTKALCGHGDETTIGRESAHNPFLNDRYRLKFYR